MSNVVVTGATGLFGPNVIRALRGGGHDVVAVGHTRPADERVDLTDRVATAALLRKLRPEVVVNLVAHTDVDQCERDVHGAYLLNARTVENIVAALSGLDGAFLIQISTDHVYDRATGLSSEDDVHFRNNYALTKYVGDLAAMAMPSAVLRTNLFGKTEHPTRASFTDWINRSLSNGAAIQVFEDAFFTPLSMHTLAAMVARVASKRPRGIFNVGSRDGMSKADFAFAFAAAAGLPTTSMTRATAQSKGLQAARPTNMQMDCTKFEQAIGETMPTLSDEINRVARDYHA